MLGGGTVVKYDVVFQGQAQAGPGGSAPSAENLEAFLERVMEELLSLRAEDATVGATLASGQVEISVTVQAASFEEALEKGNGVIRTAFHAAGGFTPGWSIDWGSVKTTKAESEDDQRFVRT